MSTLLCAARWRTAPQLYIKGRTSKPARLLQDEEDAGKQWLAVVVIKYGQPPTVIPVPKPNDPGSHSVWLSKNKNPDRRDLTGETYKKFIKDTLLGPGNLRDGTLKPPRHSINLLHDRDAAHKSKVFSKFAATYNINAVLLPPRCPDLNPLDYGVFGAAQKKLDREMELRRMSWEEQCSFLETAIKSTNVDAAIMALPQRIKRCIAAKGGHFE